MSRKRLWLLVLFLFLAFAAFWGYRQYTTVRRLEQVGRHAKSLALDARGGHLDSRRAVALADDLDEVESLLVRLRRENAPLLFLASRMEWMPRVGGDLQATPAFLDAAVDLAGGGAGAVRTIAPALDGDAPMASRLAGLGRERLASLPKDADRVADAERALSSVEGWRLSPRVEKAWRLSMEWLPALEAGLRLAPSAPWLLGVDAPRRYLVLLQNNQELRPTGGFISGVGIVTVVNGKITRMSFQDSYAVEDYRKPHPSPPPPLVRIMNFGVLTLRDSNWSPDFPTTARVAAALYSLNRGVDVDGVVAVDLEGARMLVDAVGPLEAQGYPEPINGKNFMSVLEQFWNAPPGAATVKERNKGSWWKHRKDFMGLLAGAAMGRLQHGGVSPTRLARAVKRALDEQHILFYPMSEAAEKPLAAAHWDGALRPWGGDYVMVVDANLGYNKVNVNVSEEIEYHPGREAEVVLTYRNRSPKKVAHCVHEPRYGDSYSALESGCYWDYVRLYVPKGSKLLSLKGSKIDPDVGEEAGKAFFGAYFVLPPGKEHLVVFRYAPPVGVLGRPILFQKQPGTMDNEVKVLFREPVRCRWNLSGWNLADEFSARMTADKELICR